MTDYTETSDLLNASYVQTAVTALVVYEHMITFDQEVTIVWQRPRTVSTALFLSIRYCLLLQAAIPHIGSDARSCDLLMKLSEALAIVGMLQIAIFSALRTSVLFPHAGRLIHYIIFVVIFVLGAVPIGTLSFVLAHSHAMLLGPPLDICQHVNEFPHKIARKIVWATRVPMIIADAIVLVLTWMRSAREYLESRRYYIRTSLTGIVLIDGTVYFVVLLALNLAQMLTFGRSGAAPVTRLVRLLPSVLISRFLLNLRQWSRASETQSWSTLTFRTPSSFLGNIGEPLEITMKGDGEDMDDDEFLQEQASACRSSTVSNRDASLSSSARESIFDSAKDMYQDSIADIPEGYSSSDEEEEAY